MITSATLDFSSDEYHALGADGPRQALALLNALDPTLQGDGNHALQIRQDGNTIRVWTISDDESRTLVLPDDGHTHEAFLGACRQHDFPTANAVMPSWWKPVD